MANHPNRSEYPHGKITKADGTVLRLSSEAFLSGTTEDPYYEAYATDPTGNRYNIRWEILDAESDDESNRCDWDKPYSIKAI